MLEPVRSSLRKAGPVPASPGWPPPSRRNCSRRPDMPSEPRWFCPARPDTPPPIRCGGRQRAVPCGRAKSFKLRSSPRHICSRGTTPPRPAATPARRARAGMRRRDLQELRSAGASRIFRPVQRRLHFEQGALASTSVDCDSTDKSRTHRSTSPHSRGDQQLLPVHHGPRQKLH